MHSREPCFLSAAEAAAAIAAGTLTSEALVLSCLERIEARDHDVKAWLHIDPDHAIRQARQLDARPVTGPLYGLPFGIKDIIDTVDAPTTYNSPAWQGHRPARDAACVSILRSSGAVILGKTDTVEFAFSASKAASRNPFNVAHSPGGSSSGSGAAVGDYQVPFALGTQTGGSQIRPASMNGVYGLKTSWGAVSCEGVHLVAQSLDTVGWFGRSVADLILAARAFRLDGIANLTSLEGKKLRIGYCETPYWAMAETGTRKAVEAAIERLLAAGVIVAEVRLPKHFDDLAEAHRMIVYGEGKVSLYDEFLRRGDELHPELLQTALGKRGVDPKKQVDAYDLAGACRREFDSIAGNYDAILAPAAAGEAPAGLQNTGSAIFNSLWTLLHVPCVAIPAVFGDLGLPVGIQLIGARFSDARILNVAQALERVIDVSADDRLAWIMRA